MFKHWWALMSCAAFTGLGVYAAATNKGNSWVVDGSAVLAVVFFVLAAFLTWNDEHQKYVAEVAKNQMPDIKGQLEMVGSGMYGISTGSGETSCSCDLIFDLSLCNHRPVNTTLQGIDFDGSQLNPPVVFSPSVAQRHEWFPAGALLTHGIGVTAQAIVEARVSGTTFTSLSLNALRVHVIDAFGNRHLLSMKQGQTVEIGYPVVPPDAKVSTKINF
jgi:hypothetical protein